MFANPGLPIPRKNRHVHPHRLRWLAAALLAAGAPMAHAIDASGDASGAQLNLNAQLLLVHATATAPPHPPTFSIREPTPTDPFPKLPPVLKPPCWEPRCSTQAPWTPARFTNPKFLRPAPTVASITRPGEPSAHSARAAHRPPGGQHRCGRVRYGGVRRSRGSWQRLVDQCPGHALGGGSSPCRRTRRPTPPYRLLPSSARWE